MSISSITSSSSVQTNIAALSSLDSQLQNTELQLATGKAVNVASDDAATFYAAQSFLQQANDLSNLKNNLSTSLATVASATNSIGSVTQVVQQLQGIVTQASGTTDTATRASLASQYNALLPQLDQLVNDASFNGTNLLNNAANSLVVHFNASNTSGLTISGVNITAGGLNISAASNAFASASDLNAASTQLQNALSTLSSDAAGFGGNATLIQTNQDFTSSLANNLQDASNNLTVADVNQAGASLLAEQAQSQLSITSLGVSGQLSDSVLKLFS